MSIGNQATETLKKESVETLLRDAFTWNHEEEDIYYMIVENLDKINDDNVKTIANAMSDYVYHNKNWIEAGQVLRKYGIEFEPYSDDPYKQEEVK